MRTPAEITQLAEEIWHKKAYASFSSTLVSWILAGMYIALGWMFSVNTITGSTLSYGLTKLFAWLAFSLWLILVMIAGAELFTGNALLIIAYFNKKISHLRFLRNLILVRCANFIGAVVIVGLLYGAGWFHMASDGVATNILTLGVHKVGYGFVQAFCLGILCNILVCLGVWLAYAGKTAVDKIAGIIFPVTAFVACGFEHSVANMFYLPFAYLLKFVGAVPAGMDVSTLTLHNIFIGNFLPVTLGNFVGGALFVGALYWILHGKSLK